MYKQPITGKRPKPNELVCNFQIAAMGLNPTQTMLLFSQNFIETVFVVELRKEQ